eukprot:COSAG06_NODE_6304_length_2991_cov_2.396117_3_plen_493_part_01
MSRRRGSPGGARAQQQQQQQQTWGGVQGRAISPGASFDGRASNDEDYLGSIASFQSSVSDLDSTMTLGAAGPEESDGAVQELLAELRETQQMVAEMDEQMSEQEEKVRAAERRSRDLKEQLEQERVPLLHADAKAVHAEEKLKDAMKKMRELRQQCDQAKKERDRANLEVKRVRAESKRAMEADALKVQQHVAPRKSQTGVTANADASKAAAAAGPKSIVRRSVAGGNATAASRSVRASYSRTGQDLDELKRQVQTLSRDNAKMRAGISELNLSQSDSAGSDRQTQKLKAEVRSKMAELATLQAEKTQLQSDLHAAQERLAEEAASGQAGLDAAQEARRDMEEQLATAELEKAELMEQVNALRDEVQTLQDAGTVAEPEPGSLDPAEAEALRQRAETAEATSHAAADEIAELQNRATELEHEIEALRAEAGDREQVTEALAQAEANVAERTAEVEQLEELRVGLQTQLADQATHVEELEGSMKEQADAHGTLV